MNIKSHPLKRGQWFEEATEKKYVVCRGDALRQQVVRQHHARSAGDRTDLVPAVGVEGDELQLAAAAAERHILAVLLDRHLPAAE
jgi:hypothetical protein